MSYTKHNYSVAIMMMAMMEMMMGNHVGAGAEAEGGGYLLLGEELGDLLEGHLDVPYDDVLVGQPARLVTQPDPQGLLLQPGMGAWGGEAEEVKGE